MYKLCKYLCINQLFFTAVEYMWWILKGETKKIENLFIFM